MNYVKEAESKLYYYHTLQQSIEEADRQIARLVARAGPKNLSAMVLDGSGVRGGAVDETVNILFEIQELQDSREKTRVALAEIDELLKKVSQEPGCEKYGPILRKWYIEKKTKETIAEEMEYSVPTIYSLRNAAIRKFAVLLFGIKAWKAV
ncbi:MAG: hypothetical protein A4E55_00376 [Pelotomaculum sp. PtaU1.Bin035]|nr:MAG: hypothetical protein A4E55_00376 [Pelotomaculum sp. PtaU1.Bin035]